MAGHERKSKPSATHRENSNISNGSRSRSSEHEAILAGVMALANLFSNCVEAFQLIHPVHRWDREEQLLLCQLGIQQARLLVWGDVVGISSPPSSVTDRAIPKHPSSVYPDLTEPTFFGARDPRLDEPQLRTAIEEALSAIVDRSSSAAATREEMMEKYGLRPPKRLANDIFQPALDTNRLEGFREHYELLKEVAEAYAQLGSSPGTTRRNASLVQTSWTIANPGRFATFIALTQEKVNFLIELMGVGDRVDRAVRMDIKAIGWHLTPDRGRIASDRATLRLVYQACKEDYPAYLPAIEAALANVEKEWNESMAAYATQFAPPPPRVAKPAAQKAKPTANGNHKAGSGAAGTSTATSAAKAAVSTSTPQKHQSSGRLFGGLFKGLRHKNSASRSNDDGSAAGKGRSNSLSASSSDTRAQRSHSDSGPAGGTAAAGAGSGEEGSEEYDHGLQPVRSKSVGALIYPSEYDDDDEDEDEGRAGANGIVNAPAAAAAATALAGAGGNAGISTNDSSSSNTGIPVKSAPSAATVPSTADDLASLHLNDPSISTGGTTGGNAVAAAGGGGGDKRPPPPPEAEQDLQELERTQTNETLSTVPDDLHPSVVAAAAANAALGGSGQAASGGQGDADVVTTATAPGASGVGSPDASAAAATATAADDVVLANMISRHDMYHGIGRQGTRNQ